MSYFKKYLKYKSKYISIKYKLTGGAIWMENSRGNSNDGKYPPCYNICKITQTIYDILEKNKLQNKFSLLLNLYSIILCQEVYLKTKTCKNTMLDERLMEVNKLFDNRKIKNYHKNIVNNNIKNEPKHKEMRDLLEKITVLIEEEINKLKKEKLTKIDLTKLERMNKIFYQNHYPIISLKC